VDTIYQVFTGYDRTSAPSVGDYKYCPCCAASLELTPDDDRHRPWCPRCGFIQFKNPAPAVAILIVRDDRVLLGKRSGPPGAEKWATLSGYIEFDEDFLTTGIREAKEETGLEVEIVAILNVASSFISPGYHFFSVYLLGRVIGGDMVPGSDMGELRWFPLDQPMPVLAFEEDAMMIERIARGDICGLPVDRRYASMTK